MRMWIHLESIQDIGDYSVVNTIYKPNQLAKMWGRGHLKEHMLGDKKTINWNSHGHNSVGFPPS